MKRVMAPMDDSVFEQLINQNGEFAKAAQEKMNAELFKTYVQNVQANREAHREKLLWDGAFIFSAFIILFLVIGFRKSIYRLFVFVSGRALKAGNAASTIKNKVVSDIKESSKSK
jgi:hypothetical protein